MLLGAELGSWLSNISGARFVAGGQLVHTQEMLVAGAPQDVTFSVIKDNEKLREACDLINERYAWRGYGSAHSIPSDAHHTTFTAEVDDTVVGTITLAIDSEQGLAIDSTFADRADKVRQQPGTQICELKRLAFDPSIRSKEVLAGLFHLAFIYGTSISDCTDLFIEVRSRHAPFYESMLGFQRMGSPRANDSVGVPSQLMRLEVDAIRHRIYERAGEDQRSQRSLYQHFFSLSQEVQIRRSLALAYNRQMGELAGAGRPEYVELERVRSAHAEVTLFSDLAFSPDPSHAAPAKERIRKAA